MLKSVMHVESILKKVLKTIKSMLKFSAGSENCKKKHVENFSMF